MFYSKFQPNDFTINLNIRILKIKTSKNTLLDDNGMINSSNKIDNNKIGRGKKSSYYPHLIF